MKPWIGAGVVVALGFGVHELWAAELVRESVAATLLAGGARTGGLGLADGTRAIAALLFVAYRLVALSVGAGLVTMGAVSAATAVARRALFVVHKRRASGARSDAGH